MVAEEEASNRLRLLEQIQAKLASHYSYNCSRMNCKTIARRTYVTDTAGVRGFGFFGEMGTNGNRN